MNEQREAVDLLTIAISLPFCAWLGWWGIPAALAVGTAINALCAHFGSES